MSAPSGCHRREPGVESDTSPLAFNAAPPLPLRVFDPEQEAVRMTAASPSLQKDVSGLAAYEMKFLLDEPQAAELEARLRDQLMLDPHAAQELGAGYRLTTLYCDTPRWDVFHRNGRYRLFKFRLRRYGEADFVFLERKSKRGWQVRKRRSTIPLRELDRLFLPPAEDLGVAPACQADQRVAADGAEWYRGQLARNQFKPVCQIEYQRMAYFGHGSEGPLRLTFDRRVRGALAGGWSFAPLEQAFALLPGKVVCEFKYRGSLPAIFKRTIESMQLTPRGVSKYRHCIQAAGGADVSTPESEEGAADA